MTDGFRVDLDELAAHAGTVDGYAARMGEIAGAAQPLGLHAYGIVGQSFAETAARTAEICSVAVASLATLIQDFGDRLRSTAAAYQAVDDRAAASFEGIR